MKYSGYKDEWIRGDFFIYLIVPEPTSRGKYFDGKLCSNRFRGMTLYFKSELYELGRLLCALSELQPPTDCAHGYSYFVISSLPKKHITSPPPCMFVFTNHSVPSLQAKKILPITSFDYSAPVKRNRRIYLMAVSFLIVYILFW